MQFKEYQKIPTDTKSYKLSKKEEQQLFNKVKWVVLEKVHGSNFSIYCDGTDTKFAKRSAFLESNEWFYNYETIRDQLSAKTVSLVNDRLKKEYKDMQYCIVYGELLGGFYPSDVTKWKGAVEAKRITSRNECLLALGDRAIQEGIYYSPNIEYISYDIVIIESNGHALFMNYDQVMSHLKAVQIHYLEPLLTTSFTNAMKFNLNFDSKVPVDLFKQQKLPSGTNIAEGVVIKPLDGSLRILDKKDNDVRCMVKLKNPQFLEISSEFTPQSMTASTLLLSMINTNRLNNLKSKIGQLCKAKQVQLVQLLIDDVWKDYWELYAHIQLTNLDVIDQQLLEAGTQLFTNYFIGLEAQSSN
jgi:Rnl2 family RNA ligase